VLPSWYGKRCRVGVGAEIAMDCGGCGITDLRVNVMWRMLVRDVHYYGRASYSLSDDESDYGLTDTGCGKSGWNDVPGSDGEFG